MRERATFTPRAGPFWVEMTWRWMVEFALLFGLPALAAKVRSTDSWLAPRRARSSPTAPAFASTTTAFAAAATVIACLANVFVGTVLSLLTLSTLECEADTLFLFDGS